MMFPLNHGVVASGLTKQGIRNPSVAGGEWHTLALTEDSSLVSWGRDVYGLLDPPVGLTDVIGIDAGKRFSVALKSDGTVVCWGQDEYGQINPPVGLSNVVEIRCGERHTVALKADGSIDGWGFEYIDGDTSLHALPPGSLPAKHVAAGARNTGAILTDNSVLIWGGDSNGMKDVPADAKFAKSLALGGENAAIIDPDGYIKVWGADDNGQVSNAPTGPGWVSVSASYIKGHLVALKSDGTVYAWGFNNLGQSAPPALSDIVQVSTGQFIGIAVSELGEVTCWGANTYGQCDVPDGLVAKVSKL